MGGMVQGQIVHWDLKADPSGKQSKARVCGRSLAGVAGSNPAGAWMFVFFVLYSKDKRQKPG
jgi:hypothetical protein